ncbi:hypothetical protein DF268_31350 [Streptomyces sp. V2]|uniref:hypothetical protein n=1 Tax=Streptomyces sp. V2 TaxID=1424099 RepID=UPI000D670084|nr:hypothetical protein [Streptomyces sp. V2]PWG09618.1 hypothetical protein DF268_31350 [Streptomyces sp. V2]
MRVRHAFAVAVAGSAMALSGLAAPAAHAAPFTTRIAQGDDYARWDLGDKVTVCDRERDGNGVYVGVWLVNGYDEFGDSNGSAAPCSSRTYDYGQVEAIQVCEDIIGPINACSAAQPVDD